MQKSLGIYAVSVIAFRFRPDLLPDGRVREGSLAMHLPALIPAESIQAAAASSREFAFSEWPKEDGWYGHQAAIQPVTNYFLETGFAAFAAGAINASPEDPSVFPFEE